MWPQLRGLAGVQLTGRGVVVALVAVAAAAMAAQFGARSLNAVIVPVIVALVAGALQVGLRSQPTVSRSVPPDGHPGDTETVRLRADADDTYPARVIDGLSAGLAGNTAVETVVGGDSAEYEIRYLARGEQTVGPAVVVIRDVLGVAERRIVAPGQRTLLVYPTVRTLPQTVTSRLRAASVSRERAGRGSFEGLREYDRGDPLRDVHWKSSAKRGDLVVQEFEDEADTEGVTLSVGAEVNRADEMAEAAASLAASLLGDGVPVTLHTPDGSVEATPGDRAALLGHLAQATAGDPPNEDADVIVHARTQETAVRLGDERTTFERLVGGAQP